MIDCKSWRRGIDGESQVEVSYCRGFWFQPESKSNSSSASHLADGMFNLSISSAESSSSSPSASTRSAVGDRNACSYIIFDSSCWAKVRKERSAEIT